ncbi:hypothetical protein [Aeromicrobium sp. 9AM]|uniref:hypothetical protein n=1 Tax=Aeromicrobium sp. 9AM TaxID=2653126 RepID=UPI0012F116DA|nr:hypothetical protein [Aeromicrobium sp. 9AM]VXC05797.1 conserved hypothetical protein [Aeromicrobium sp. 9AM]
MFKRRKKNAGSIDVDDDGVRRVLPDGTVERVRWDELREVRIATTADGPFNEDVFWLLSGGDLSIGVALPGSYVDDALMRRFQALPGFDNEQVIAAMSSMEEAQFVVWAGTER